MQRYPERGANPNPDILLMRRKEEANSMHEFVTFSYSFIVHVNCAQVVIVEYLIS